MRVRIDAYFTPEADLEQIVTNRILKANTSIYVAMYSFTHPDFTRAMYERRRKGVACKVILDRYTANEISEVAELHESNIPVNISTGWGKLHHKFCVIDSKYTLCGSANWSKVADKRNAEDFLFISSKSLALQFEKRFNFLWKDKSIPFVP